MATIIDMPKLSDTMTEGTIATWLKNEGDQIEAGDVIAEIETDKATMELEAFEDGILIKQIASTGSQITIGSPIAAIGEVGETYEATDSTEPTETTTPSKDSKEEASSNESIPEKNSDAPENLVSDAAISNTDSNRIKASPLARKLAEQKGIDLNAITGTGPNGRIVKKDVISIGSTPSSGTLTSGVRAASPGIAQAEDIPVSQMRSVIAKRLQESKNTAPHFYL